MTLRFIGIFGSVVLASALTVGGLSPAIAQPSASKVKITGEDVAKTPDGDAPVEIEPGFIQWTPPTELHQGSVISTTLAEFAKEKAGLPYITPSFAIASEKSWPDALIAANTKRTLLLNESNNLEPEVHKVLADSIRAHKAAGAKNTPMVYILGGPDAISEELASEVRSLGYDVIRLSGNSRIETSVASVSKRWWPTWEQLSVVRGTAADGGDPSSAFADTITALQQAPAHGLVLSASNHLHASIGEMLLNPPRGSFLAKKETEIDVWGGEQAIDESTFNAIQAASRQTYYEQRRSWYPGPVERYKVKRIEGVSRYDTNIKYQEIALAQKRSKLNEKVESVPIVIVDGAGPYSWQLGYAVQRYAEGKAIVLAAGDEILDEAKEFIQSYGNLDERTPVTCLANETVCEQVYEMLLAKQKKQSSGGGAYGY